jgi:hypothetical protein
MLSHVKFSMSVTTSEVKWNHRSSFEDRANDPAWQEDRSQHHTVRVLTSRHPEFRLPNPLLDWLSPVDDEPLVRTTVCIAISPCRSFTVSCRSSNCFRCQWIRPSHDRVKISISFRVHLYLFASATKKIQSYLPQRHSRGVETDAEAFSRCFSHSILIPRSIQELWT